MKLLSRGEGVRTLLWTFIKSFQVRNSVLLPGKHVPWAGSMLGSSGYLGEQPVLTRQSRKAPVLAGC